MGSTYAFCHKQVFISSCALGYYRAPVKGRNKQSTLVFFHMLFKIRPTSPFLCFISQSTKLFLQLCLITIRAHFIRKSHLCSLFSLQCLKQYVQLAIKGGAGGAITCPDPACKNTGTMLDSEVHLSIHPYLPVLLSYTRTL